MDAGSELDELLDMETGWATIREAPQAKTVRDLIDRLQEKDLFSPFVQARTHLLLGIYFITRQRPSYDQALRFFGGLTDYKASDSYMKWYCSNLSSEEEALLRGRMAFNYGLTAYLGKKHLHIDLVATAESIIWRVKLFPELLAKAQLLRARCLELRSDHQAAKLAADDVIQDNLPIQLQFMCRQLRNADLQPRYLPNFKIDDLE